jgi:hypothetical protein
MASLSRWAARPPVVMPAMSATPRLVPTETTNPLSWKVNASKGRPSSTSGELAALTTDLPAVPDSAPEPKDLARIDCRGSSVTRDGRSLVPLRMEVRVTGGSVTLDFTEAVILQPSLLIDADVSASRLTLVTKPGVVVDTEEVAAEGSYVKVRAHGGPEVPVILRIQVSGKVSGGHLTARPPGRTFWRWLRRHPQPHAPASL